MFCGLVFIKLLSFLKRSLWINRMKMKCGPNITKKIISQWPCPLDLIYDPLEFMVLNPIQFIWLIILNDPVITCRHWQAEYMVHWKLNPWIRAYSFQTYRNFMTTFKESILFAELVIRLLDSIRHLGMRTSWSKIYKTIHVFKQMRCMHATKAIKNR